MIKTFETYNNYQNWLFDTLINFIVLEGVFIEKKAEDKIISAPRKVFSFYMYENTLYTSSSGVILNYGTSTARYEKEFNKKLYDDALNVFEKLKKYTINNENCNEEWYKLFENWKGDRIILYNYLKKYKKIYNISDEWLKENEHYVRSGKIGLWDLKKENYTFETPYDILVRMFLTAAKYDNKSFLYLKDYNQRYEVIKTYVSIKNPEVNIKLECNNNEYYYLYIRDYGWLNDAGTKEYGWYSDQKILEETFNILHDIVKKKRNIDDVFYHAEETDRVILYKYFTENRRHYKFSDEFIEKNKHYARANKTGLWNMKTESISTNRILKKMFDALIEYDKVLTIQILTDTEGNKYPDILDKYVDQPVIFYTIDFEKKKDYTSIFIRHEIDYAVDKTDEDFDKINDLFDILYNAFKKSKIETIFDMFNESYKPKVYDYFVKFKDYYNISNEFIEKNKHYKRSSRSGLWDLKKENIRENSIKAIDVQIYKIINEHLGKFGYSLKHNSSNINGIIKTITIYNSKTRIVEYIMQKIIKDIKNIEGIKSASYTKDKHKYTLDVKFKEGFIRSHVVGLWDLKKEKLITAFQKYISKY